MTIDGGPALAGRMAHIGGSTMRAELLLGRLISAEGGHFIAGGLEPYAEAMADLDTAGVEVAVASLAPLRAPDPELFAALTCGGSRWIVAHESLAHVELVPTAGRPGVEGDACVVLIVAVSVPFGATAWIFFSGCCPDELIGRLGLPSSAPTDAPFGFTLSMAARHRNACAAPVLISEPYPVDVNVPNAVWRALDRLAFTLGQPHDSATAERPNFADRLKGGRAAFRRAATADELAWIAFGLCRRYAAFRGDAPVGARSDRKTPRLGT